MSRHGHAANTRADALVARLARLDPDANDPRQVLRDLVDEARTLLANPEREHAHE